MDFKWVCVWCEGTRHGAKQASQVGEQGARQIARQRGKAEGEADGRGKQEKGVRQEARYARKGNAKSFFELPHDAL
jgi:hypothetical protein